MNKRSKICLRNSAVGIMTLLLGACATTGDRMAFKEYRQMDDADKTAYEADVDARVADKVRYDASQEKLLWAELPVYFEEDGVKFTKKWDRQGRRLSLYEGYVTGALGSESLMVLSLLTEEDSPKPWVGIDARTGKPGYSILVGNVSVQETMLRTVLKSLVGSVGPAVNGYFAAKASDCGDGCGNTTLINAGGNSSAAAVSQSGSSTKVDVQLGKTLESCTTGCL